MRLLHVIDSLDVGGAERMLVEIANAASEDAHKVFVCVTRSATVLAADLDPQIGIISLNRHRRFDLCALQRLADFTNRQRMDVIHSHGRTTLSFLGVVRSLGLTRVPVVLHDHYGGIETDTSVPYWFKQWGRHHVAQYVGVCAKLADWASMAGLPHDRIHVIANALNIKRIADVPAPQGETLRNQFGIPKNLSLGVVLGGLRHEKGIDVLLKALPLCQTRGAFRVVLTGGERDCAYARACRDTCDELGLDDLVSFAGQRTNVAELLSQADFALLPSRSEADPVAIIEYMLAGLPFVATPVGGIQCRLSKLGLPELVPTEDAQALADAIDRLMQLTPLQRRQRGESGREVARRDFNIRAAMPLWYAVYNAALATCLSTKQGMT